MAIYKDERISEVIDNINIKYFLPDIQRPFVWKQDQIYALFDSIMRGYPISTFLFWKIKRTDLEKNKIKKFPFIKTILNVKGKQDVTEDLTNNESEYFLVLDGQQRLTSLFVALKGSYFERSKEKELFFNVLSQPENEDEDGLCYEFKFLDKKNNNFFKDDNKVWVNIKRVYECRNTDNKIDLRSEILNVLGNNNGQKVLERNIDKLYDNLKAQQIINYYSEDEQDYDKVLDIFVRTNSGGTKLTYSDLLFSTIKLKWKDARESFDVLLKELNNIEFDFDTDFVLKTCFVFFAQNQNDVKYSRQNVNDDYKINLIINNWSKITESLKIARDLLIRSKINNSKLLTSNNALIPIAYFIYKYNFKAFGDSNQKNVISQTVESDLRSFLISSLLTGLFGGQADTILYALKQRIDEYNSDSFPLKEIKTDLIKRNKSLDVNEEFLDSISYHNKNSYLILNLLYSNIDLMPSSKTNSLEQDHLFSQDELKSKLYSLDKINQIYNIRYLTSISNKKKSNMPFNEWLDSISLDEKKIHLIPDGVWTIDNYDGFLDARKKLMLEKLNQILK